MTMPTMRGPTRPAILEVVRFWQIHKPPGRGREDASVLTAEAPSSNWRKTLRNQPTPFSAKRKRQS